MKEIYTADEVQAARDYIRAMTHLGVSGYYIGEVLRMRRKIEKAKQKRLALETSDGGSK